MFLAIEIGGTKLQVAVGRGNGEPLVAIQRAEARPQEGAEGIRRQILEIGRPLIEQYAVRGIGIGFGGPVQSAAGRTIVSHQVEGWKDFPLGDWCRENFGLPAALGNDSDMAGLAEARFGAGEGNRIVFYTNVGSGIGGALVIDGEVYPGSRGVASELGHLRPGLECTGSNQTLEAVASGWGITAAVQRAVGDAVLARQAADSDALGAADPAADADSLLSRCHGRMEQLTTKIVAEAALDGNALARAAFDRACHAYGWGIAQMATLLAPGIVVVGGGVALAGEELWFKPLRQYVRQYVFPPLAGTFDVVPAKLGEEVVLHGALALAASRLQP
jgi:glucokinase